MLVFLARGGGAAANGAEAIAKAEGADAER